MPLMPSGPDETPQERAAGYRAARVEHATLLLPFDALSRLQREVALHLAAQWGRELADVDGARADIGHASHPRRPLSGLWLLRLLNGPIQVADAERWTSDVERWRGGEPDPRLDAFEEAFNAAAREYPPVRPPGPGCTCAACEETYGKARRRRKRR